MGKFVPIAAAKQRGVKLGRYGAESLSKRNARKALAFAEDLRGVISALRAEGHTSVRAICDQLNQRGIATAGGVGRKWHIPSTYKLLKRIETIT